MAVIAISFFSLLVLGIPIAYVLGVTSIIYIVATGNIALFDSTPQRMFSGLTNYSLLAIPLFVLVGELMNSGGITSRLIGFAKVIIGHFRGGLAYVNIVANMFLASILGSANAQTAMMSRVMIPEMEKEGYKREFSAAVTVSGALMGPIIPPSLLFILYSVLAETSVSRMFLAGIAPGVLLGIGFAVVIYIISLKEDFPKSEKSTFKQILAALGAVLPALCVPVIILAGILTGAFTATEASAVAAFISLVVGVFLYRELKWSEIPDILIKTATNSAIVTFVVVTANLFGWVMAFERLPQMISEFLVSISTNTIMFLFLINILFLIVGMFLDGIAALFILVPVLLPAAIAFGVDPVQFGVVICINLTIGLITPPVGTALFIASAIGEVKIEKLIRALMPFLAIAIVMLLVITYVSPLTSFIPDLIEGGK
jgi:tripartite ATP-independent transporter DctM subunit